MKKPGSTLMGLPAEIRSLIYEFALTSDKTVVTFCLDSYQRDSYNQATQPALSRVSRQVRCESLPVYYECNDFVLHTENPKADNARQWLRCNHSYLEHLRRISLWVRYVPRANDRASSQGAISISMFRRKKYDSWKVDDEWLWKTVVRKPANLQQDVKFILARLGQGIVDVLKESAGPDDYAALMTELRESYVIEKISRS